MKKKYGCDDYYLKLAAAIVYQAVKDYSYARSRLSKNQEKSGVADKKEVMDDQRYVINRQDEEKKENGLEEKYLRYQIKDCEGFFESKWIKNLTQIDGKRILKKLQEEEL